MKKILITLVLLFVVGVNSAHADMLTINAVDGTCSMFDADDSSATEINIDLSDVNGETYAFCKQQTSIKESGPYNADKTPLSSAATASVPCEVILSEDDSFTTTDWAQATDEEEGYVMLVCVKQDAKKRL